MARESPSLQSWLTRLVMVCLLPAVIASTLLVYFDYKREHARIDRASIETARALTLAVDRELTASRAALTVLATSPHLTSGDLPEFYRQAKEVLRMQPGGNIVLSDADRNQILNTYRPFGEPLPKRGVPENLRQAMKIGGFGVSDLFIGPVTGRPLIAVEIPVKRNGKFVYGLGMGILPERLGQILIDQQIPPDVVVAIFDSTGTVVARTHDNERYVGKKGAPALVKRMAEVTEGSIATDTLEGIPVTAAFSRSTLSNWTVAIGTPRSSLTAELWQSLRLIVAGTVALLILGVTFASLLSRKIAGSMRLLTNQALALGHGQSVLIPPLHLKEANDVGRALERASQLIEQRTAERDRAADAERQMLLAKEKAEYSARHDALTGLANRTLFMELIEYQIMACQHQGHGFAVLYIDLDGFKSINDRYGHDVGDNILRMTGARLRSSIRHSDAVARLGGDEFAALLADSDFAHAGLIADKLVDELSLPYSVDGLTLEISASIGVACCPESGFTAEELLRHADQAMYRAKSTGKHRYAIAE